MIFKSLKNKDMKEILNNQRTFFNEGYTQSISFRILQLKKLKRLLLNNEAILYEAIYQDFKKSKSETYITELGLIYQELKFTLKHLKKWYRPRKVKSPLITFPSRSYIIPQPYGTVLIIGSWNFPFQLIFIPLISAIAAGNTSIIKPSELAPKTASVIVELLNKHFDCGFIHAVQGGAEASEMLLKEEFDKIFFTGSFKVGKMVACHAAKHLTPVTLELGGKNPCIVFADTCLKTTVKRIIWGKFLNAGQVCTAPDYILVEESIYEQFLITLKNELLHYQKYQAVQIINDHHFNRLIHLIDYNKVYAGGQFDLRSRHIEPTILRDITYDDDIMQEEIFGPILPVLSFKDIDQALSSIKSYPPPLAFYLFSNNKKRNDWIINRIPFGGGAINDVIVQMVNPRLPFGGVGASGMGAYHGEAGFNTFTHFKSIIKKSFWFDLPIRYHSYTSLKLKIFRALYD